MVDGGEIDLMCSLTALRRGLGGKDYQGLKKYIFFFNQKQSIANISFYSADLTLCIFYGQLTCDPILKNGVRNARVRNPIFLSPLVKPLQFP